jgi:hypothetical protein
MESLPAVAGGRGGIEFLLPSRNWNGNFEEIFVRKKIFIPLASLLAVASKLYYAGRNSSPNPSKRWEELA